MNKPIFFYWTKDTMLTKEMTDNFYQSTHWKKCRRTVLERDDYLCQVCLEDTGEPIPANTVHHIVHLKDNPSKSLELNNLISVCFDCHNDLHPEKSFGKKKVIKIPKSIKTFVVNENEKIRW